MALSTRTFLGRAFADDLLVAWQVAPFHEILWNSYEEMKRNAREADEEMRRRLGGDSPGAFAPNASGGRSRRLASR
jgi:hypothetical protein